MCTIHCIIQMVIWVIYPVLKWSQWLWLSLYLLFFLAVHLFSPNLECAHTHYFKRLRLRVTHDWTTSMKWLAAFETVLLKSFSSFPCGLVELVNGWFLVGLAESQGDRNKSPETCGENKAEQSLLESFDVFSFSTIFFFWNSRILVANKKRSNSLLHFCSCPVVRHLK